MRPIFAFLKQNKYEQSSYSISSLWDEEEESSSFDNSINIIPGLTSSFLSSLHKKVVSTPPPSIIDSDINVLRQYIMKCYEKTLHVHENDLKIYDDNNNIFLQSGIWHTYYNHHDINDDDNSHDITDSDDYDDHDDHNHYSSYFE